MTEPQCPASRPSFSLPRRICCQKQTLQPTLVVHTVISRPGKLRHEGGKFEANLGDTVRLSQTIKSMAEGLECLPRMHKTLASVLHHGKQV